MCLWLSAWHAVGAHQTGLSVLTPHGVVSDHTASVRNTRIHPQLSHPNLGCLTSAFNPSTAYPLVPLCVSCLILFYESTYICVHSHKGFKKTFIEV